MKYVVMIICLLTLFVTTSSAKVIHLYWDPPDSINLPALPSGQSYKVIVVKNYPPTAANAVIASGPAATFREFIENSPEPFSDAACYRVYTVIADSIGNFLSFSQAGYLLNKPDVRVLCIDISSLQTPANFRDISN